MEKVITIMQIKVLQEEILILHVPLHTSLSSYFETEFTINLHSTILFSML